MTEADKNRDAAMRSVVLITRPLEDSEALVGAVTALGLTALVDPMLKILPDPTATADLKDCAAILFTSANGVRAFAGLSEDRSLPVVAVGPASAAESRKIGFKDVTVAGGDVEKLIETVSRRFPDPAIGTLFHAAGSVTAGDLKEVLEAKGYSVRRSVLYAAQPAAALSPATRDALDAGQIGAVPIFSPRTARILVGLLEAEERKAAATDIVLVALSASVAKAAGTIAWKATHIAAKPTREALISSLSAVMNTKTPSF